MIDKTYRCDLCRATCTPDMANGFLVGLYWTDFPIHGWTQRLARETDHHICKTCLVSLQTIGENKKPTMDKVKE